MPLVFEKKFAGHHWVDKWTINGKSFPKTDPIRVKANGRYRLVFDNRSDEAHPVHLHRHTFELSKIAGVPTSGVFKDVVVVAPKSQTEVDLMANNPRPNTVPLPSADAYGLRIHDADGVRLSYGSILHPPFPHPSSATPIPQCRFDGGHAVEQRDIGQAEG